MLAVLLGHAMVVPLGFTAAALGSLLRLAACQRTQHVGASERAGHQDECEEESKHGLAQSEFRLRPPGYAYETSQS